MRSMGRSLDSAKERLLMRWVTNLYKSGEVRCDLDLLLSKFQILAGRVEIESMLI
jgi:hypothetical protein